jgi:hypothetical protein
LEPSQAAASHVHGSVPLGSETAPISLRISVSEEHEEGPAPYITYEILASASTYGALAALHMALQSRLARLKKASAIGAQHVPGGHCQGGQKGGQIVAKGGPEAKEGRLVVGQQRLETALEDLRELSRMAVALKVGALPKCLSTSKVEKRTVWKGVVV